MSKKSTTGKKPMGLVKAVKDIRKASARETRRMSDGGSSGKSDTNDG